MTPQEAEIDALPVVRVEIASLDLAGSPRRAGADPDQVAAMAAAPAALPPIVVHGQAMRVIDGNHRVRAALRRGETTIEARIFAGAEADAYVLSVWLNVAHGLPLPLADRKKAAERITVSHPRWSDRRVAAVTGISPGTVADVRRQVSGAEPGGSRVGQDGRVRPLDSSAGRRLAGRLMTENPGLSLRQVARAAAISPETARDVRNRLLRGADPIPERHRRGAGPEAPLPAEAVSLVLRAGPRRPVPDLSAVVNRLKSDPALRYTETGRNLLRVLSLHTAWTEQWESIVGDLPPHCTDAVAHLAEQFAVLWSDFATRTGREAAESE